MNNSLNKQLSIALVSDVPPDNGYAGGQVLRRIIDATSFVSFDFFWLNQSNLPQSDPKSDNCKLVFQHNMQLGTKLSQLQNLIPFSPLRRMLGKPLKFFQAIRVGLIISKRVKELNYDYVWLVLQGELLTITYLIITLVTQKKIVFQQWDPISWWCAHRGHGIYWQRTFEYLVNCLEKLAFVNLVPSQQWKESLEAQKKRSHRIDNFIDPDYLLREPIARNGEPNDINAVFLGQFYANNELTILVEALADYAVLKGKKLNVHYFGNGTPNYKLPNTVVHNHGYLPRETLIDTIRQWDLALLPYPFDKKLDKASQYSFPSKSRIYIAAGLPILAYAQSNSSPHLFFQNVYSDYYNNLASQKDIDLFINKACNRSINAERSRIKAALHVVSNHFSREIELYPLHRILIQENIVK